MPRSPVAPAGKPVQGPAGGQHNGSAEHWRVQECYEVSKAARWQQQPRRLLGGHGWTTGRAERIPCQRRRVQDRRQDAWLFAGRGELTEFAMRGKATASHTQEGPEISRALSTSRALFRRGGSGRCRSCNSSLLCVMLVMLVMSRLGGGIRRRSCGSGRRRSRSLRGGRSLSERDGSNRRQQGSNEQSLGGGHVISEKESRNGLRDSERARHLPGLYPQRRVNPVRLRRRAFAS